MFYVLWEAGRTIVLFLIGSSFQKASTFQSETFHVLSRFSPASFHVVIGTISTFAAFSKFNLTLSTTYTSFACLEAKTLRPGDSYNPSRESTSSTEYSVPNLVVRLSARGNRHRDTWAAIQGTH